MNEPTICPICNTNLRTAAIIGAGGSKFECPNCGPYRLSSEIIEDAEIPRLSTGNKVLLSHLVRLMYRPDDSVFLTSELVDQLLRDRMPPNPAEQVDNLITFLGENSPTGWENHDIRVHEHCALIGTTPRGLLRVIAECEGRGYLGASLEKPTGRSVQLTLNGWNAFEKLKAGARADRKAFMAMKFGDVALNNVFTECFVPAVASTGFQLRKLDDEPRAGLIDDHLRVEIRGARFVVADLTHANLGAYWEAGFAEGLGKPVIYTCRHDVFESPETKPHFDTNHHQTVPWDPSNLADAAQRLKDTIRATLPGEARLTDD